MTEPENNLHIDDRSLGQILRAKRLELDLEISEIRSYLKVKRSDIEAIEDDEIEQVAKHIYIQGLIRSYAKLLKVDPSLIEKKIKLLPVKSNVENKKHLLINIGEHRELTPTKDIFFNCVLISILMFLVLLSIYNSYEKSDGLITDQELISELEKMGS